MLFNTGILLRHASTRFTSCCWKPALLTWGAVRHWCWVRRGCLGKFLWMHSAELISFPYLMMRALWHSRLLVYHTNANLETMVITGGYSWTELKQTRNDLTVYLGPSLTNWLHSYLVFLAQCELLLQGRINRILDTMNECTHLEDNSIDLMIWFF